MECFVDKAKAGRKIDGVPVVDLRQMNYSDNVCVIVTPTYVFKNIYEDITIYDDRFSVVSLDDVL